MIKVGSDFSGVGAFNQALMRLDIDYDEIFACDMDKYARETFIHNYGEPKYYPKDVYERQIPKESLDIYMTSPPCQAFSLAGKRLGKDDKRGILFFNSHEFIKINKPRYFIFENVKGLLSDDNGKTFSEWINMLGGKSVNGLPVLFPYEDSVPYHIYYKVMNSKKHGVPQNRERVFIVGIRDDKDNHFRWAKEEYLKKRLKDVLEDEVDDKYFLSDSAIKSIILNKENIQKSKVNPDIANALQSPGHSCGTYKGMNAIQVKQLNQSKESGGKQPYQQNRVYDIKGINPSLNAGQKNWGGNIINTGNKRLDRSLETHNLTTSPTIIDSYNNTIHSNHSPTISTRVNASACTHLFNNYQLRRLTPRECFRLMDFPDSFTWTCSDTQAYKQAGNSIVVRCLELIINKFNL